MIYLFACTKQYKMSILIQLKSKNTRQYLESSIDLDSIAGTYCGVFSYIQ